VEGHVLLDRPGEGLELLGRDAPEGQLDPHHLALGLALAVDALLEAELDERVLVEVALQEARGLRVEVVELPLEDRDYMSRDVLGDHLGVVEGPGPAVVALPGGGGSHMWTRSLRGEGQRGAVQYTERQAGFRHLGRGSLFSPRPARHPTPSALRSRG